ncbi:hypothetical protein GHT06_003803 [Daphnia sinensis]|uniref:Uncharacterized protein n=1 Tax=Daphnia sinensis TaxID=1820382 RepID=A0AAD5PKR3_9CRUS|nr:hypothetical protein GHT06_003803 [Daphnia sinensis]
MEATHKTSSQRKAKKYGIRKQWKMLCEYATERNGDITNMKTSDNLYEAAALLSETSCSNTTFPSASHPHCAVRHVYRGKHLKTQSPPQASPPRSGPLSLATPQPRPQRSARRRRRLFRLPLPLDCLMHLRVYKEHGRIKGTNEAQDNRVNLGKSVCHYCCHSFSTQPVGVPIRYKDGVFICVPVYFALFLVRVLTCATKCEGP